MNEAFCALGKPDKTGLYIVRYFQKIFWAFFFNLLISKSNKSINKAYHFKLKTKEDTGVGGATNGSSKITIIRVRWLIRFAFSIVKVSRYLVIILFLYREWDALTNGISHVNTNVSNSMST